MRLSEELASRGCHMEPEAFEGCLAGIFKAIFPGETPDTLLVEWPRARDYGRAICQRVKLPNDGSCDEMITRRLINLRKRKPGLLPAGPRPAKVRLRTSLDELGLTMTEEAFRTLVWGRFRTEHPDISVDRFLGFWQQARHFAATMAASLGIDSNEESDKLILGTILNLRRKGGADGPRASGDA